MKLIEFSAPLANAVNYPNAVIKVHAAAGLNNLQIMQHHFSDECGIEFFRTGRSALYHAAIALKRPDHNLILLPAYHCPALVEPFLAAGYLVKFYPLDTDLTVSQHKLADLINAETTHCLLVRYFGHAGNVGRLLPWLAEQGITTFDDCAHDLQTFLAKECHADATITSLKKFIPSYDGGALRLKNKLSLTRCDSVPLYVELKNVLKWFKDNFTLLLKPDSATRLNVIHYDIQHNSEVLPSSDGTVTVGDAVLAPDYVSDVYRAAPDLVYRYLQPLDQTESGLRFTKLLFKHVNIEKTLRKRRQNSQYIQSKLRHSPLGRLLWSAQETNIAPYVIPFVLYKAETFDFLRRSGLQIYRWEELAATECKVSKHYRLCLIQIPCHQDLTQKQLDEIVVLFTR